MLIFFIILLSCFAILYFNNVLTKFLFFDDPNTDTPPPSDDTPPPSSDTPPPPPSSDTPSPPPTLRPTPHKPPPPILPRTKKVTKPKLTKTSRPTQPPTQQPPTQQPSTQQPSTQQPSTKTVDQLLDDFKKTGQQICSCEHVFHSVIRDHRTNANFTSDSDKKCLDLAKAIMATTSNNMQQICTYRDKIFHPQCRGPSLNGGRCS
jgi:outer membrane biosynthesis protein TonB